MLPVLVSIPHGGTETPPEIANRVCITPRALFDDSDAFTREIYDVTDEVVCVEAASIARAFVDLNRARDDRPPRNPDGVVKTATCYNEPIYTPGMELTDGLSETLLSRYYDPYYKRLREAMSTGILLALDCHSMAERAPRVSPDRESRRPLFCLSNDNGRTCPPPLLERLAGAFADAFELGPGGVRLNDPFRGGNITCTLGSLGGVPWVQIEMNRSLYLAEPWFDRERLTVDSARLSELRTRFLAALRTLRL